MAYTLQTSQTSFKGGKNILASEHLQFIEAGATLDAATIGAKTLEVGTAIMRNTTSGKFEEYADDTGAVPSGYDEFTILNIDVEVDGTNDVVVGEVIFRGSVYDAKLPSNVTDAFKTETKDRIRYVKHI
ncbi:hypothetical protein [Thalassobacillus sp. CUG 92003]|uniref:hypothetical protein n=1 Tax=Thalassobacillus sp. CUG 92003 TaxID=2736641 RepID=UPI0015E74FF9|nr:hypothetical protein [Thalassobacillus sp. CUG 92003]